MHAHRVFRILVLLGVGGVCGAELGEPAGRFSLFGNGAPLAKAAVAGKGPWALPPEGRRAAATADMGPAFRRESVEPYGWRVLSVYKGFGTLEGDSATFDLLQNLPGITNLKMAEYAAPGMDEARVASRVHAVLGWGPQAVAGGVTGKGVLIGIIDDEFDAWHPAFRDAKGASRFALIWNQMKTADGTGPFGYGRVRNSRQLADDTTFGLVAGRRHGTAVAGVAAGSDPSNAFYGVAPEATLLGAVNDFSYVKIKNAVEWMFRTADSLRMPCVINMSFGSTGFGSTGFFSTFGDFIDSVTGPPGRIIVQIGGNEGGYKSTVRLALSPSQPVGTWVKAIVGTEKVPTYVHEIQFFGEPKKPISFSAKILDSETGAYLSSLEAVSTTSNTSRADTVYWKDPVTGTRETLRYQWFTEAADPVHGCANFVFGLKATKDRFRLGISLTGTGYADGRSWRTDLESRNLPGYQNGEDARNINFDGAGKKSIVVGAYTTKTGYTNWMGLPIDISEARGRIASFSSRGPLLDGRIKPDICAPGALQITAFSSGMWLGQTTFPEEHTVAIWPKRTSAAGLYGMFNGTSASTPMVAGAVALLLQKKPDLNQLQMRELLQSTAYKDEFTGPLTSPDPTWGAGKLDVAAALRKLDGSVGLPDRVAETDALRSFWSGNRLIIMGWTGEGVWGSLSDWRGRRVADLRPSGPAAWTADRELPAGIYVAALRGPRGNTVIKVAKE